MDRPRMPPAHRYLPDDVTPPGHEPVKYVVGPGDLTRGELGRGASSKGRAALVDVVRTAPGVQVGLAGDPAAAAGHAAVARLLV